MNIRQPNDPSQKDLPTYEILRIHEYSAVDSWDWVGILTVIGGGQYIFLLEQELYTDSLLDGPFSNSLEEFSEGSELFEFIQGAWREEHEESLDEKEWLEIIQTLGEIDEKLAQSVVYSFREEFDEVPAPVELSNEEKWAYKASWERTKFGGGGGQWAAIAEKLRGEVAILFYVRRYQEQNQELPTGLHHIRLRLGSTTEADCPPPRQASGSGIFERDVNFPER